MRKNNQNEELKIYFNQLTSEFNDLNINDEVKLSDILNNLYVSSIILEDNGTSNNFNDCWSISKNVIRNSDSTLIKNDGTKKILPYLLNSANNRLILPTSPFTFEFKYLASKNTILRFVNLKGKYANINLSSYGLKKGDQFKIKYTDGLLDIYVNDFKKESKEFTVNENAGYITWRISEDSFVEYSDLKLCAYDLSLKNIVKKQIKIETEFNSLKSKIQKLEREVNKYEKYNNEIIESNNFLFNNLYLDHKLESKNILYEIQMLCTELLAFIDNICKKHGLNWWLDYGSLIGAVRHNSFIPWDDDTDIGMMREDYHKLDKILLDEIKKYNLDDIIKVSYRNRVFKGKTVNGFIQIFVMHHTPDYGNTIFGGVDIFPYDYLIEYDDDTIEDVYDESKNMFYDTLTDGNNTKRLYMGLNSEKALDRYFTNLKLSLTEEKYIVPGVEGGCGPSNVYDLIILNKEDLFPLKSISYNNKVFPCPNNFDKHLKSIYGNYMNVPKTIRTHGRTDRFRYYFDIDKTFREDYLRLKRVNTQIEKEL